ncbi:MAG: hypothetical protein K5697_01745 [Lachnospiraceae bacterium]|nr:hypothetical protein [Lachnospiraceae bacterium]
MYDLICVMGAGKPALDCCRILSEKVPTVIFYDVNEMPAGLLKGRVEKLRGVEYLWFDKNGIFEDIGKRSGRILLLSIVNPYIIPKRVLTKEGLCAVNLHHALLPRHPGRNAEAWAIFEQDEEAGISWHFIGDRIDGGNIIAQKSVALDAQMTSRKLLKLQNELIVESFSEFIGELLEGKISGRPQEKADKVRLHYSYERPADGRFDMDWPANKMSAFLRAMDYGPIRVLGDPEIFLEGERYIIDRYEINAAKDKENKIIFVKPDSLCIIKDRMMINMQLLQENSQRRKDDQ